MIKNNDELFVTKDDKPIKSFIPYQDEKISFGHNIRLRDIFKFIFSDNDTEKYAIQYKSYLSKKSIYSICRKLQDDPINVSYSDLDFLIWAWNAFILNDVLEIRPNLYGVRKCGDRYTYITSHDIDIYGSVNTLLRTSESLVIYNSNKEPILKSKKKLTVCDVLSSLFEVIMDETSIST